MISKDPKQQLKRYCSFMAEDESDFFLRTMNLKRLPSVLGESRFTKETKEKYFKHKRYVEVPESKRLAPDTDRIIEAVCGLYNTDRDKLVHTKRGTMNEARSMAVYLHRHLRGETLADIGSYSTVSSINERFKVRILSDRKLSRKITNIKKSLMSQGKT